MTAANEKGAAMIFTTVLYFGIAAGMWENGFSFLESLNWPYQLGKLLAHHIKREV